MNHKSFVLETPVFHKVYELYKLLDHYFPQIPKAKRYTLWQRCETITLELMEALIKAGHFFGKERSNSLRLMSQKLDLLKVFIRLAKETHTIETKQYITIESLLQEIGKMIGGWIKSASH